jgi:hypothetical protein
MKRPVPARRTNVEPTVHSNIVRVHLRENWITRAELIPLLTNEAGAPLVQLAYWTPAFVHLDDPGKRAVLLWLARQRGKSTLAAVVAILRVLLVPGSYVLMVAASEGQAAAIFLRKLRRVLERLLDRLGIKRSALIITKRSVEVLELGSKIEVVATSEVTSPGRSVDLLIFDEARDIPDAVFTALAPSVLATGGKILACSTAGRPRGWFYEMVMHPLPETAVVQAEGATNPFADQGMLTFLERQLARISPAAARRELGNEFTEDSESFLPEALIEAAIDDALVVLA